MSFQQGVSGLNAAGRSLDVIGNNVANASTIGAKASRAEFADIYARATGGASVGIGVAVSNVAQQFGQGAISASNNSLDLAINGAGFFQVKNDVGMVQYTRNGQFRLDREGNVVNASGMQLLGHPISSTNGVAPGEAEPLTVPTVGSEPTQTTLANLEINVNALSEQIDPALQFDPNNSNTYNNSTSLTVYDAKGQPVAMSLFFRKTDKDTWNVYGTANGQSISADGSIGASPHPSLWTIGFDSEGQALPGTSGPFDLPIGQTGVPGDAKRTETLVGMQVNLSGMTQFGAPFGPTNLAQNGMPPGKLSGILIQDNGTVMASYSSGHSAAIGQIELANFRNPQGLQPLGGNNWSATFASGDPILGEPGSANLGALQSSSQEESNIDLTNELVNMMVAQRIYQANAQTIKTQDQVMQTLVNLR